jgi:hypothetical protein
MSSAGADAIAASRTRAVAATVGVGGVAISSAISFATGSTAFQIAPYSVTITTSGRPIFIGLSNGGNIINSNNPNPGALSFLFNGNYLPSMPIPGAPATGAYIPAGSIAVGGVANILSTGDIAFYNAEYTYMPCNTVLNAAAGWSTYMTLPYTLSTNFASAVNLNYGNSFTPSSAFWTISSLGAGTFTIQVAIAAAAGGTVSINGPSIVAYEL